MGTVVALDIYYQIIFDKGYVFLVINIHLHFSHFLSNSFYLLSAMHLITHSINPLLLPCYLEYYL